MHLPRRRLLQLAAAAAAAPCALTAQSPRSLTVRVGTQAAEFSADLVYGQQLGFFQRAGINVEAQIMGNGAQTGAAVAGGTIDIGLTDALTVAEGNAAGAGFVFIAPAAAFAPPWPMAIVTRADDGIREPKDLNGKTIGVISIKNGPSLMTYDWIDRGGGDSRSLKWLEIPFSASIAAIQAKRIDGALLPEPFIEQARDAGLHVMVVGGKSTTWMVDGWMSTRAWADQNREAVRRFAAGIRDANRWANTHAAEAYPIVAKYTKMPEPVIAAMIPHPWIETLDAPAVQVVLDRGFQYGVLSRPVRAKDIFYVVR